MSGEGTDPSLEGGDNREEERPAWLPENFKSPEDLAKSYQEAQRKITEQGQEIKGLNEAFGELTSQFDQFAEQQNRPDPNDVRNQLLAMYENDPVGTMAQIAQQTAQQVLAQSQSQQAPPQTDPNVIGTLANAELAARYQDWPQYANDVRELVSSDPLFQNEQIWSSLPSVTNALDRAYKMVRADKVLTGEAEQLRQQADSRQMKLAAQSAVGATGRPEISVDAAKQRWDEIMAAKSGKLDFS